MAKARSPLRISGRGEAFPDEVSDVDLASVLEEEVWASPLSSVHMLRHLFAKQLGGRPTRTKLAQVLGYYSRLVGTDLATELDEAEDRSARIVAEIQQQRLDSHDVTIAAITRDVAECQQAITVLRKEVQALKGTTVADRTGQIGDLPELLRLVEAHRDQIAKAFAEAFDTRNFTLSAHSSLTAEYPVTITIDASGWSDAAAVKHAREQGARYLFYQLLSEQLPAELLDSVDFMFRFPQERA